MRLVRVDRASGKQVYGTWPGNDPKASVIWEAFKPESEPRRNVARSSDEREVKTERKVRTQSDSDFLQRQGGIY